MPTYNVGVTAPDGESGDVIRDVVAPTGEAAIESVRTQLGSDFADWAFNAHPIGE